MYKARHQAGQRDLAKPHRCTSASRCSSDRVPACCFYTSPRRCPAPQAEGWELTLKYTQSLDFSGQVCQCFIFVVPEMCRRTQANTGAEIWGWEPAARMVRGSSAHAAAHASTNQSHVAHRPRLTLTGGPARARRRARTRPAAARPPGHARSARRGSWRRARCRRQGRRCPAPSRPALRAHLSNPCAAQPQ